MDDNQDNLPANFPAADAGGEIIPYLSPKQRGALLDWVYRDIGGAQGMSAWAKKSDENRTAFYRMWAKMTARPVSDEEADKKTGKIEELLARLDAGEGARVISNEPDND